MPHLSAADITRLKIFCRTTLPSRKKSILSTYHITALSFFDLEYLHYIKMLVIKKPLEPFIGTFYELIL